MKLKEQDPCQSADPKKCCGSAYTPQPTHHWYIPISSHAVTVRRLESYNMRL